MMSYASNEPTTRIAVAGRGRVAVGNHQPPRAQQNFAPVAPSFQQAPVASAPLAPTPPIPLTGEPTANGGWAVATLIFFWPLAFLAFSRSLSVPMLLAQGRVPEARVASDSVARLGKIAVVCGVLAVVVLVVVELVILRGAASLASQTAN